MNAICDFTVGITTAIMANMEDANECVTFALQGESLCRQGDFRSGVQAFLHALRIGTSDPCVRSAIYIQLGNAYFYLEDYDKALEYHRQDLRIANELGDPRGEAKASGNIAMTLKCLGKYAEAVVFGQRQLELYRKIGDDDIAVSRALYNLGNIYLAKAKACIGFSGEIYDIPQEAKEDLECAMEHYQENYKIVTANGDLAAQGRVCGNLGSVQYLMGNFPQSVMHHQERLVLARECRDIPAERRAYTNLGNCHVFLGQYALAEQYYLKALALVDPAQDRALEAQACYSLGNTYSLSNENLKAIEYYERHWKIAKELHDVVGEGRACWSLGAAYAALGMREKAVKFAEEHLRISQELGDAIGASFAQTNIEEYSGRMEGEPGSPEDIAARIRRISMEHMDLLRLTPDSKSSKQPLKPVPEDRQPSPVMPSSSSRAPVEEEDFFDMLSRAQSKRLDDQRAVLSVANKENHHHRVGNGSAKTGAAHHQPIRTFDDLMDLIAGVQSKRLNEQRAELPSPTLTGPSGGHTLADRLDRKSISKSISISEETEQFPDEQFFDMLMRVQGARMGDQRADLATGQGGRNAPTVPEEDFSNLVHSRRAGNANQARDPGHTFEEERK